MPRLTFMESSMSHVDNMIALRKLEIKNFTHAVKRNPNKKNKLYLRSLRFQLMQWNSARLGFKPNIRHP